jgi:hypothetical protein
MRTPSGTSNHRIRPHIDPIRAQDRHIFRTHQQQHFRLAFSSLGAVTWGDQACLPFWLHPMSSTSDGCVRSHSGSSHSGLSLVLISPPLNQFDRSCSFLSLMSWWGKQYQECEWRSHENIALAHDIYIVSEKQPRLRASAATCFVRRLPVEQTGKSLQRCVVLSSS